VSNLPSEIDKVVKMEAARTFETLMSPITTLHDVTTQKTLTQIFTLKMDAARSSEKLVSYHNPEDLDLNLHRREKFNSHTSI
jgi:hypothetical protein